MAKSVEEFNAALEAINVAVEADVEQDKEVVRLVKILIEKVKALPGSHDFEPQINAVVAAVEKLGGDNVDVKAALDEAAALGEPPVEPQP